MLAVLPSICILSYRIWGTQGQAERSEAWPCVRLPNFLPQISLCSASAAVSQATKPVRWTEAHKLLFSGPAWLLVGEISSISRLRAIANRASPLWTSFFAKGEATPGWMSDHRYYTLNLRCQVATLLVGLSAIILTFALKGTLLETSGRSKGHEKAFISS